MLICDRQNMTKTRDEKGKKNARRGFLNEKNNMANTCWIFFFFSFFSFFFCWLVRWLAGWLVGRWSFVRSFVCSFVLVVVAVTLSPALALSLHMYAWVCCSNWVSATMILLLWYARQNETVFELWKMFAQQSDNTQISVFPSFFAFDFNFALASIWFFPIIHKNKNTYCHCSETNKNISLFLKRKKSKHFRWFIYAFSSVQFSCFFLSFYQHFRLF